MKTIQPTPSQAAVVLKNFLREQGVELKLGQTQEAVARIYGYSSWNVLTADMPPRGARKGKDSKNEPSKVRTLFDPSSGECRKCGCHLIGGYCFDQTCPYSDWPQHVDYSFLWSVSTAQVEQHYKLRKRRNGELRREPTLKALELQSLDLQENGANEDALKAYFDKLETSLVDTGLLSAWRRQQGRDECADEDGAPYVQVSFDRRLTDRFVTELVFTVRDHILTCYVRTWEIRDGLDHSRDYGIFDEPSGDFDTDAERPDADSVLSALVRTALAEAEVHKSRLMERVNVR